MLATAPAHAATLSHDAPPTAALTTGKKPGFGKLLKSLVAQSSRNFSKRAASTLNSLSPTSPQSRSKSAMAGTTTTTNAQPSDGTGTAGTAARASNAPMTVSSMPTSHAPGSPRGHAATGHAPGADPTIATASVLLPTPPPDGILLGAIDQGTTSSRFIVFDTLGRIVAVHQMEFDQLHLHAGWTEHAPNEILDTVLTCMAEVAAAMDAAGIDPAMIKSIGVTNQRETTVAWDSATGQPLCNAIVWHDTRPQAIVDALVRATPTGDKHHYARITGLPINTYFSAVKMRWMLDNVPDVQAAAERGTLRFGTVDSWLIYKLTDGAVHATDATNASRTLLMDIHTRDWSQEMLQVFGIQREWLPEICASAHVFGHVRTGGALLGVPISGCLGDQQAALVGQRCFQPGDAKNTYGTGCFLLLNTGGAPAFSSHGLLTTVAYDIPHLGPPAYALEGSVAVGGAAIKFLRDNLQLIKHTAEVNELASQVKHTSGVVFVPALSGLYAPYWRADARGTIVGMTTYTDKRHIARATLEAVAFQCADVLRAMNAAVAATAETTHNENGETNGHANGKHAAGGAGLTVLKVDGGMSNSSLAMQLQADLAGVRVERPVMRESTALGAALAAALAVGAVSPHALGGMNAAGGDAFEPTITQDERERRSRKWAKAVEKACGWVDTDDEAGHGGRNGEVDEVVVD